MLSEIYHASSAYVRAKKTFKSKEQLARYQAKQLKKHLAWIASHSPFYKKYQGLPLDNWPISEKASMMENFDTTNTAKLQLHTLLELAHKAETNREFSSTFNNFTVGLSSGTSGQRGLFVASSNERATWAGAIIAKTLTIHLRQKQRIALFLRANSSLYTTLNKGTIQFDFFDLMQPFKEHIQRLKQLNPTILVAPAQVLVALANQQIDIQPQKVYSVAEVLSFDDKQKLEDYFKQPIHQIYQATEGFLGATCEHGNLHLNEEFVHFEFEWLDKQKTRAIPIITDFTRKTQPIIRYKMTDVLIMDKQPCPCGRHTHVVQAIEGRSDDIINAPSSYETSDTIPLFSDPLHRALLQCLPIATDYRLHYAWKSHTFTLYVNQHLSTLVQEHIISRMKQYLEAQGVILEKIQFNLCFQSFDFNPMVKVRRITMTP